QPVACSGKGSFDEIYRLGKGVYTQTPGATPRKDSRILEIACGVNGKHGSLIDNRPSLSHH
ncbi:MAG: hypothetical protein RB191_11845, partial [Terriglobia bacterium]|nr:hypothetical protein [Terriglobia bacterium]